MLEYLAADVGGPHAACVWRITAPLARASLFLARRTPGRGPRAPLGLGGSSARSVPEQLLFGDAGGYGAGRMMMSAQATLRDTLCLVRGPHHCSLPMPIDERPRKR